MKHRSLIIFIIIVAALAVAPEAAEQLFRYKDVAAERAVRSISNAFLNLYAERLKGQASPASDAASPAESSIALKEVSAQTEGVIIIARAERQTTAQPSSVERPSRQREATVEVAADKSVKPFATDFDFQLNAEAVSGRGRDHLLVRAERLPELASFDANSKDKEFEKATRHLAVVRQFVGNAPLADADLKVVLKQIEAEKVRNDARRERHNKYKWTVRGLPNMQKVHGLPMEIHGLPQGEEHSWRTPGRTARPSAPEAPQPAPSASDSVSVMGY